MEVANFEMKHVEELLQKFVELYDVGLRNKGFTLTDAANLFTSLQFCRNVAEQHVFTTPKSDSKLDVTELQKNLDILNAGLEKACENGAYSMNNAIVAKACMNKLLEFVKERVVPKEELKKV